ncbi:Ubiquitin fusion degradation protein 4, partial [Tulasnella sp. 408]
VAKSTPQPTAIPIPVIPPPSGDSSTPVPAAASIPPNPIPTGTAAEDIPTTGASTPAVEPVPINPSVLPFDGLPPSSILAAVLPTPSKRSSSSSLDPQDAIIVRCRIIRFKYLMTSAHGPGDDPLESMQALGRRLAYGQASETEIKRTLSEVAALFGSNGSTSVSSFELMKSGLVDELLEFATAEGRKVSVQTRQRSLLEAFTTRSTSGTASPSSQIPLAVLVKRLQESLTRLESFEVVMVSQGEDSKRGSAQMLARQLRLRLVAADGTTVPRNCTNITVSIHAIATFQALHDYLRPRVAGVGPGASGISGVLAAFAAAAGIPSSALSGRRPVPLSGSAPAASMPPPLPSSSGPSSSSPTAPTPASAASAPPAAESSQPSRRRSLRLRKEAPQEPSAPEPSGSGSNANATPAAAPPVSSSAPAPLSSEAAQAALADLMDADDLADDYVGDDFDDEIVDENPTPANERTVSLAVADGELLNYGDIHAKFANCLTDGQRVEAQTPQGTRVATPNPAAATAPTASPPKTSYATALKTKPTDWHLEFSMEDHPLPLDMTVYGAVHQNLMRKESTVPPLSTLWNNIYTVKFKKVPGPVPVEGKPFAHTSGHYVSQPNLGASDTASTERAASPMTTSAPDDAPHSKILRLLRVLYKLNTQGSERLVFDRAIPTLPESAFVNNKLTAKLTRQLEEPMIVASSCLPDWALDLPQHYPFLFPFATRFSFLQSTSFGYARLILKWQSQQSRSSENNSRRDDAFGYLGRLQRQKVRISRKFLLESAIKVLELYGSSSSVLEVEYFDEVGTGLGPTLEFYSLVSREFARKNIKMWHDADPAGSDPYVSHPTGLYPAPLSRKEISEISSGSGKKRTDIFKLLGQFIAKALLDSRIIDISLNKLFLKFILGEEVPVSIASLKLVDPALAQSLLRLQAFIDMKRDIEANMTLNPAATRAALANLEVDGTKLEDLALDFTLPGYDIELRDGGKDISVDASNIEEYLREVLETFVGRGVQVQAQAFREGFSKVFPVTDLQSFSPEELSMMFGNAEEDWSVETLNETIKADHGFNIDSRAIRNLIEVMASYDGPGRRAYLQFITGSPRLPVGGFRGLNPPLTVVRKPHEPPLRPDNYLPSVMTCVNYLKLPDYSSKDVMKQKLNTAMKEGRVIVHTANAVSSNTIRTSLACTISHRVAGMVGKEAEYRDKVRANLRDVLELLQSKKVTDRKMGLEQIEQVFSHDQAVEYLEPADEGSESKGNGKTWLSVFQAMFNVVVEERRAYLVNKKTTAQENKLEGAARKLRWLTKRALRKINRRLLKALITHLTQCIHEKGEIIKPLASEYSDTLYVVLSYPPHLDHITAESWNEILVLAFSGALGDPIPRPLVWTEDDNPSTYRDESSESDETESAQIGSSRKRTRAASAQMSSFPASASSLPAALSTEQINLMGVLRLLIRSPHAPILQQVDVSEAEDSQTDPLSLPRILLSKFARFFRQWPKETSGHKNAVLALSALLTELEFNAREVLSEASVVLIPQLLSLWKVSTKSKDLKESLLISLRVLFPFRLLVKDGPPLDLDTVCKNLEDGVKPQKDWKPLPLESLRLTLLDFDSRHGEAFCARTFQRGFNFDDQHAFVWCAMEFHADCIIESMRRAREAIEPPTPRKAKKRPRLQVPEPVGDLIRRCTRPTTPEVRYYSLQVALFVIDRHWTSLTESDRIDVVNELTLALGAEDVTTQSLSFLCLAAIAALSSPDDHKLSEDKGQVIDWNSLWEKGIRNAGVLSVCRAAIHMLHMILRRRLVERTQMLKDIVRLLKDVAVQGPAQPSDSVCSFFTEALQLAGRDMRLHQLNLGDNVLAWLSDCWSVGPLHGSKGRLLRSYTVKDMLSLLEAICNLH